MRLVNKDKLLAPGKCLVCERIPQGRVVDTQVKNFNNAANDPMRGRKYICDRCGQKIAEALAYPSPTRVERWRSELEVLSAKLQLMEERAKMSEALEELTAYFEKQKEDIVLD
jgi:uncharacterized protein YlaI